MKHAVFFAGMTMLACALAILLFLDTERNIHSDAFWKTRIEKVGAVRAYAELADVSEGLNPSESHALAHYFGGALYAVRGISGISVCDDKYIYGCLHEFMGRAIASEGLSELPHIGEVCENILTCFHGIGHGILAFLGYDEESLREALSACESLPAHESFGGCWSGVFMEYDLQSMLVGNASLTPLEVSQAPLSPCDTLPGRFAPACYFWQPHVWKKALSGTLTPRHLAARMGEMCSGAGEEYRLHCAGGVGQALVSIAAYDPARLIALCESATPNSLERLACRASAGRAVAGSVDHDLGLALCKGLLKLEKDACERHITEPYKESFITFD
jgi:hypothetical protein